MQIGQAFARLQQSQSDTEKAASLTAVLAALAAGSLVIEAWPALQPSQSDTAESKQVA